ncbi:hypothetical protein GCM10011332_07240 [Terasakiella brassicae]|uniref:Flagellin n=1 Tax=Terasakiella brassicae TaxID=1634917 RepID=A0A917BTN9_9PROT|nr:flagellin [Terasakiella brassicae]GGF56311.1 hypothetical protein GCM10011332_07240 [Terasakiella brassicae]
MADITLSTAVRSNLLSLQSTSGFIERTQGRLSTGLSVAGPVDDAVKFFQAKSLSDRASDLMNRKSSIEQGINALKTALEATSAMEKLVDQIKGVIDSARSGDPTQREAFNKQIGDLGQQLSHIVGDATYQGLNLLNSTASSLSVRFSDSADSKLKVDGINFELSGFIQVATGGGSFSAVGLTFETAATEMGQKLLSALGFVAGISTFEFSTAATLASFNEQADLAVLSLDATISNLRAEAAKMAGNVAILQVRADFTQEYSNVLGSGASQLTVADLNEEGANLLALQTRQQMGIQALSFAGQSEQAVLGLFR